MKVKTRNIINFFVFLILAGVLSLILYLILGDSSETEGWSPLSLRGSVYGYRGNSKNKCYCNATNDENFDEPRLLNSSCCTSCKL